MGKGVGPSARASDPDIEDANTDVSICLMPHTSDDNVTQANRASWVIDSGDTSHICNDHCISANVDMVKPCDIRIGDKFTMRSIGRGKIEVSMFVYGKHRK